MSTVEPFRTSRASAGVPHSAAISKPGSDARNRLRTRPKQSVIVEQDQTNFIFLRLLAHPSHSPPRSVHAMSNWGLRQVLCPKDRAACPKSTAAVERLAARRREWRQRLAISRKTLSLNTR